LVAVTFSHKIVSLPEIVNVAEKKSGELGSLEEPKPHLSWSTFPVSIGPKNPVKVMLLAELNATVEGERLFKMGHTFELPAVMAAEEHPEATPALQPKLLGKGHQVHSVLRGSTHVPQSEDTQE
jgi:hypothetical protein